MRAAHLFTTSKEGERATWRPCSRSFGRICSTWLTLSTLELSGVVIERRPHPSLDEALELMDRHDDVVEGASTMRSVVWWGAWEISRPRHT